MKQSKPDGANPAMTQDAETDFFKNIVDGCPGLVDNRNQSISVGFYSANGMARLVEDRP